MWWLADTLFCEGKFYKLLRYIGMVAIMLNSAIEAGKPFGAGCAPHVSAVVFAFAPRLFMEGEYCTYYPLQVNVTAIDLIYSL